MAAKRFVGIKRDFRMPVQYTPAGMEDSTDSDDEYLGFSVNDTLNSTSNSQDEPPNETQSSVRGDLNEGDNDATDSYNDEELFEIRAVEFLKAILNEDLEAVKEIVDSGMPVDTVLRTDWNALMFACNRGSSDIVQYLLDKGANPDFHIDKFSALLATCAATAKEESALLQCVKHLINYKADINACESNKMTPLMFCAKNGYTLIVDYLLENGANTESITILGWSALAWAISSGYEDVVKRLLEANPNLENLLPNGQSLVEFAVDKNQDYIAQILEAYSKSKTFAFTPISKPAPKTALPIRRPFPVIMKSSLEQHGDLETFLYGLRLSHVIPLFHTQKIEFSQLLLLKDEDLIKIGIDELGSRIQILEGIKNVHTREWENSSLQITRSTNLTCPVTVHTIANICKHLEYIESTVAYIHKAVKEEPQILEKGQDTVDIHKLQMHLKETVQHNRGLQKEIIDLQLFLNKICDNVEFKRADLIAPTVKCSEKSGTFRTFLRVTTISGGIAAAAFYFVKFYIRR